MGSIEDQDHDGALGALLGVHDVRSARAARTFAEALRVFAKDTDAAYFLYRFSDPAFVAGDAIVRALVADSRCRERWVLDLCGGTGHLARSMSAAGAGDGVVLADLSFWQLWLAKRFVAPLAHPVCCDATAPPFARGAFSFVVCSDAFHYIWRRRDVAVHVERLVNRVGTVLLPHLHIALSWNHSEGMPLTPDGYRSLFEWGHTRMLAESAIREAAIAAAPLDLTQDLDDRTGKDEAVLTLVSTTLPDLLRAHEPATPPADGLELNPLYRPDHTGALHRRFPSPFYEDEFEAAKTYLPEDVDLSLGDAETLVRRRVLLDLPPNYI